MRIILIDNNIGFIWGDSASFEGGIFSEDKAFAFREDGEFALAFAQAVDESNGDTERKYSYGSRWADRKTSRTGYLVYRADIDGSEAVPIIRDGQNQESIDAVLAFCRYIDFVRIEKSDG